MNYLSFGLDPALLDPVSDVSRRQQALFAGHTATIIVFTRGERQEWQKEGLRVIRPGGSTKWRVLLQGMDEVWGAPHADAVLAQAPDVLGALAWLYTRLRGGKLLLQDHSGIAARPAFGWRERVWRPFAKRLLCAADGVRTVSERGARGLRTWGVVSDRVLVLPVLRNLEPFLALQRAPQDPPVLACIARLEPEKGVDVLLRAFSMLKPSPMILEIAGTGSQRATLQQLAKILGIHDRVRWLGALDTQGILALLTRASVYVQPSRFEGWGMALVEAAAAGLPIVSTDVGCVGEVLHHEASALVVSPGDAKVLATQLERVCFDGELRQRLGIAAKHAVQQQISSHNTTQRLREWLTRG